MEATEVKRKYYNAMRCNRALMEVRRGFMRAEKRNGPYQAAVGENGLAFAASGEGSGCKTRRKEPHVQKGRRPVGNGLCLHGTGEETHVESDQE